MPQTPYTNDSEPWIVNTDTVICHRLLLSDKDSKVLNTYVLMNQTLMCHYWLLLSTNDLKSCEPVYTDVPNNHICRSADPSCLHQNLLRLQSIATKEICAKDKKFFCEPHVRPKKTVKNKCMIRTVPTNANASQTLCVPKDFVTTKQFGLRQSRSWLCWTN